MSLSPSVRRLALLCTATLLATACAGGGGQRPAVPAGGAAGGALQAFDQNAIPATGVQGGPTFDLSGVRIVVTTPAPGAINMGTFFAYKRLEEWGADVEIVVITTTSGVQTLVAGGADIASQGTDEVILGAAEGARMVAIGAPYAAVDYVMVGRRDIADVAALRGRVVGMSGPSGFDALLTRLALEQHGMDSNGDVNFVQIGGSPDRAAALLSGQVDAATIFLEDWEELSRRTDQLGLIHYMAETVPGIPSSAFFAQESYWAENRQVGVALACANLQANAWINASEHGFVDYVLRVVPGSTEEAARAIYRSGREVDMWPTDPERVFSVAGLGGLVDAMLQTGEISSRVEPGTIADTSFLREAADMGCGQAGSA
ncbi:ABC transporter substrate-binding protein [Pseudonocardia kunmingensis]|uniref:NitT/TauT family transport system substrate-binding protein n=1 Tax=Pseudonocardia kunmingensis TaxID=630975 RepID=A0A543DQ59_9PSEU|nr:ABC transporter substrate-binding protein [Pseudonocardia kunmingensis]TQM11466.1 NitT/TauT family transport system substrate-binding protein [Pseudonocardia kunmingensis]